jgi:hypothetical protein
MLIRTDALSRSSGDHRTMVAFGILEPYEWKPSCTVLRGERGGNASDLPGLQNKPGRMNYRRARKSKNLEKQKTAAQEKDKEI